MKKAIVVIAVALMVAVMLAVPVLAAPAERIPVALTVRTAAAQNTLPEKVWTTDGGIKHEQGIIRTVPLESMAGNPPAPVKNVVLKIDGVPIYGIIYAVVDVMTNTKTGVMTNHYQKWIITFPVQTGVPVEGSFEGVHTWSIDTTPTISGQGHAVMQGSGGFEGQTLMLKMEFPPMPVVWNGYLLKR